MKHDGFKKVLQGLLTQKAIKDRIFEADEIVPGVWIGCASDGCSILTNSLFKRVLNLSMIRNVFEAEHHHSYIDALSDDRSTGVDLLTLEYMNVAIVDRGDKDIAKHFAEMNAFIAQGDCLVHCQAGVSRSATAVIAYLISRGSTLELAYKLVKSKRPRIRPNRGFWQQLIDYNTQMNPADMKDYTDILE